MYAWYILQHIEIALHPGRLQKIDPLQGNLARKCSVNWTISGQKNASFDVYKLRSTRQASQYGSRYEFQDIGHGPCEATDHASVTCVDETVVRFHSAAESIEINAAPDSR